MIMCINLVNFVDSFSRYLGKNKILTSIKGRNYFENLRKMMLYNLKVDLVNVNVYIKLGLTTSIIDQSFVTTAPGNSGDFDFLSSKTLPKTPDCGDSK